MLEYVGAALGGLIFFGLGLAKQSPIRPGERAAEVVLGLISAVALLFIVGVAFGLMVAGPAGGNARVAAFWLGGICGYVIYRLYRRRMPPAPTPRRLPPGYEAMSRRVDETIRAIGADIRGGTLSPEKKQAYLKTLQENDALLKLYRRAMPPAPAHLPPEYAALSDEADRTFQAMKDAVARGEEPSEQNSLKLESLARRMGEHDEAMLLKRQRQGRMVKRAGFALAALFLVYLVIQFLNV